VVHGSRVWIGQGEENTSTNTQGSVICLDAGVLVDGQPKLVWKVDGIKVKYASPVLHEGRLYVCDEIGMMTCLEADTGKDLWQYKYGKNTKGSPVWADGKIYITEVDSRFHILKPEADRCTELYSQFFRTRGIVPAELNGSPAIADGRIYFMTTNELYCIGKKREAAPATAAVAVAVDVAVDEGSKPAHLQVIPADVTLHPGQSVEFKARTFDAHGNLLGEARVDWSLAGPLPPVFPIGMAAPPRPATPPAPPAALKGALSMSSGTSTSLTIAATPPGQFGRVVAKMGALTAYARVRVAPVLPYQNDFANVPVGAVPGGWVNTQGKYTVQVLTDGTKVLSKRNDAPSPLVSRAHAFIGMPNLTNYTIEADVQGTKVRGDMPDMGVEANRYTFFLEGNSQQLRLVSWDAERRVDKTSSFAWKPGVWYRMKLMVAVEGDKGTVRARIWPRGEAEPNTWTVEVVDPCPNREGSPALYAYSAGIVSPQVPGTNVYFANLKITPNP
jgi:hypothetical protein